jgi:SAM-dependent methyltransferase
MDATKLVGHERWFSETDGGVAVAALRLGCRMRAGSRDAAYGAFKRRGDGRWFGTVALVDEAFDHARNEGLENAFFIQGDFVSPPFMSAALDFIVSEGVLHHTGNTGAGCLALAALLRPSGQIGFYVYRKKAPLREHADDYVRELIQDCSSDDAWGMMEPLTKLGKAVAELKGEVEVSENVEVLGIRAGRYDIQRLIYYAMFKCTGMSG